MAFGRAQDRLEDHLALAHRDRRDVGRVRDIDAVLDVQAEDPVPIASQQGDWVGAAVGRPQDVELEGHVARVGVLAEDLPRLLISPVAGSVYVVRNSGWWLWP